MEDGPHTQAPSSWPPLLTARILTTAEVMRGRMVSSDEDGDSWGPVSGPGLRSSGPGPFKRRVVVGEFQGREVIGDFPLRGQGPC